jgi:hypothetical protein
MAKPPIRIKRSAVPGAIPTTAQLALGELAINTFDGKAFLKKDDGTESIVEVGGSGSGAYTSPAALTLYEKTDSGSADSFDGVETRFQLRDTDGNLVSISNALYVAASVNGVIQKPNTGTPSSPFEGFYITANATQGYDIVFDTAPTSGSDFFGVLAGTFTATAGTSGIKILDDISSQFDGILTDFTLQYNTTTYEPEFPDAIIVNVGGVVQVPGDAYSISGSTISFTAAPPSGTSFHALSFEIGEAAVQLEDSTSSTSTTTAATPNAVKAAYDLANAALPAAGGTLTGVIGVTAGTASAPGIGFTGDTNTGIYSPGADQVAVATNGVGRLFVDASGNIKVSTGEIFQTSADGYIRLDGGTGSGGGANVLVFGESHGVAPGRVALTAVGTGAILASTGGAERLRITSAGLVGIGTSNPDAQLQIVKNSVYTLETGGGLNIVDGTFDVKLNCGVDATNNISFIQSLHPGTSNVTRPLTLNPNGGRVGIGTVVPNGTLHVVGDTSALGEYSVLSVSDVSDTNKAVKIAYDDVNDVGVITAVDAGTAYKNLTLQPISGRVGIGTTSPAAQLNVSQSTGSSIVKLNGLNGYDLLVSNTQASGTLYDFNIGSGSGAFSFTTSAGERLRIDSNGRLGVGTSAPAYKLDVSTILYAANQSGGVRFGSSDSNSTRILQKVTAGGIPYSEIAGNKDNNGWLAFTTGSSDTERLRITSAGRVGIGTSSPDALLEIEDSTGGTSFSIHNTGTSGRQYILQSTSSAASIGGGKFAIYDGDAPAHRFVIDSSGRVGIGTTSPSVILETNVASGSNEFRQSVAGVTRGQLIASATDQTFANSGTGSQVFYNTGSERARIDASGRLLVGTSTARTVEWSYGDAGTPKLQVEGDGGASSQILITDTRSDGRNPSLAFAKTRNGAIVTSGDVLGSLSFFGDDGVDTRTWGGRITCEVDGTPGANDMPGRLVFSTTADGASSPTERMRIGSGGHLYATCSDTSLASLTLRKGAAGADGIDYLQCRDSGNTAQLVIASTGNVQNTNGSYTSFSDAKLKENIIDANSQWSDIKAVKIRNWNFKTETGYQTHRQIGPIAQELETICPNLVFDVPDRNESGEDIGTVTKGVNQSVLYMKAVKALQEAMERIETLEGMVAVNNITIDEQQHQLSTLAARLTALESA